MTKSDGEQSISTQDNRVDLFVRLKEEILNEWQAQVRVRIAAAAELNDAVLMDTIHLFYDNIIESLSIADSRPFATAGTNISYVHGRERAGGTDFMISNVVQELHILKRLILEMTFREGIHLTHAEIEILDESFNRGISEASDGYVKRQRENYDIFVAGISHDIRNPIQAALSSAQLIQMRTTEPATADLTKRVCNKLKEVGKMVESLLDAASLSNRVLQTISIIEFDMLELVKEAAEDLINNQIIIEGCSAVGFWSRDQMKRVLENLLSNAEKYGVPNGEIKVSIQIKEYRLSLSVHNYGPPIPKERQTDIFATFQRWHEGDIKGWGLGLSMARAIVEGHGGSIVVDSSDEKGTTFTIDVPIDCRSNESRKSRQ